LRTTAISAVLLAKIEASRSRLTKDDLIASSSVPAALVLGSLSQVWPAKRRERAVSG
jgi:hypothetical protein